MHPAFFLYGIKWYSFLPNIAVNFNRTHRVVRQDRGGLRPAPVGGVPVEEDEGELVPRVVKVELGIKANARIDKCQIIKINREKARKYSMKK